MIYFQNPDIVIRDMIPADAQIITDGEIAQGWDQTIEKYNRRLCDQEAGIAVSLVAEYKGEIAGYLNVYPNSKWGAFGNQGLPELIFQLCGNYQKTAGTG